MNKEGLVEFFYRQETENYQYYLFFNEVLFSNTEKSRGIAKQNLLTVGKWG